MRASDGWQRDRMGAGGQLEGRDFGRRRVRASVGRRPGGKRAQGWMKRAAGLGRRARRKEQKT
jgi:hypothetical protein